MRRQGKNGRAVHLSVAATLVKICGVVHPEDAALAGQSGADFVGMIMWPKTKRYVEPSLAREIASAARENGAEPVGVFVDEDSEDIQHVCDLASISIAQLHGNNARNALHGLPESVQAIYVLHADPNGHIEHVPPPEVLDLAKYILIDGKLGGSGMAFDWDKLSAPNGFGNKGLLAGGLGPRNVSDAIRIARPAGVDVCNGVCGLDKSRKDPEKVLTFIQCAKGQQNLFT